MRRRLLFAICASLLAAGPAVAQIGRGEQGLSMVKASGNVGSVCTYVFSCAFLDTPLARGENVTLYVRGVHGRPYAVALGPAPQPLCLKVPGIHNSLMLAPILVPFGGVLNQRDTIRACPGGLASASFRVPMALVVGGQVAFQALAWSYLAPNEVPTFTMAIRTTIR